MDRTFVAIDLKSFYASVECVERGLNPLTTNLVVADESRTEKTICLAVSPSLKTHGIGGRARLFEVVQRIREVNALRRSRNRGRAFTGKAFNDIELKAHPDYEVDYVTAVPRMGLYMKYSARIYGIYLKYVAPEDIHVYSCDEVFMDVTDYLDTYKLTAHELAMKMIRDVLGETGITATAGIGTNLYLCKVAMDIVAKHIPADEDGVRIAELNERSYRETLWDHKPITDFWRVGRGIAKRLATYGIDTMGKIARYSLTHEEMFYKLFGVNAELLIDHAWGWEPCTMEYIKAYRPEVNSLSSGQVLTCPYSFDKARVVVREMADSLSLDLVDKHLVTNQITLTVGYDRESLTDEKVREQYHGEVGVDWYGREVPKHAHGSAKLGDFSSSTVLIIKAAEELYDRIVNPILKVRRLNITAANVVTEEKAIDMKTQPAQLDLFTDYEAIAEQKKKDDSVRAKERRMQETLLSIKKKFGRNSVLKGTNFKDGATARERNQQVGGHRE